MVESFNGKLIQEFLYMNEFISLEDARRRIKAWHILYNKRCPYSALG
ncbi:integrase core domain-containing protein [Enterobacter hormaechei]